MRTIALSFLIFFSASAWAATAREPDNIDWLLMSEPEKLALASKIVGELQAQGIPLKSTPERYASQVSVVVDDPKIKKGTPIKKIFLSIAYAKEPAVRAMINAVENKKKA